MLTIKKRHTAIRAVTAGAFMFAVGLTGVSAFIDDGYLPGPIVNSGQTSEDTDNGQVMSDTDAKEEQKKADASSGNSNSTAPVQPATSTQYAPPPTESTTMTSAGATSPVSATSGSVSGGTEVVGGRGGGEPAPAPAPTSDTSGDCDCLQNTVDSTLNTTSGVLDSARETLP